MKRITLILADDHTVVRQGLRSLLDHETEIEVIAEAKSGREAIKLVEQLHPAVVLMDIAMPDLNGIEATQQILSIAPATRILILSAHDDDAYVDHTMNAGAAGYLIKQSSSEILAQAIRDVVQGKTYMSPEIARRLNKRTRKTPNHAGALQPKNIKLSPRERETLQLIAEGMANKQIASILQISIKTVEKHRQSLMNKLDIHEIAGLTRFAVTEGIIECVKREDCESETVPPSSRKAKKG